VKVIFAQPGKKFRACCCARVFIILFEKAKGFWAVTYGVSSMSVAALSKAWVYGRSLTGIAGSNPAKGMDVCRYCFA
jgi:hypothetical protein